MLPIKARTLFFSFSPQHPQQQKALSHYHPQTQNKYSYSGTNFSSHHNRIIFGQKQIHYYSVIVNIPKGKAPGIPPQ